MKTITQALQEANEKVALRVRRGYHEDITTARGYKFIWSNHQMRWLAYGQPSSKGSHTMDANIIIVGGISKVTADTVASMMNPLPMYGNSFEAVYLR